MKLKDTVRKTSNWYTGAHMPQDYQYVLIHAFNTETGTYKWQFVARYLGGLAEWETTMFNNLDLAPIYLEDLIAEIKNEWSNGS